MSLKEYIKQLAREILDEESTSGDAGGYLSPMAFSPKGQKKNAATKYAEKEGWKVTKGETEMPGDSKVKDYVSLTGKKKKKVKIYKESDYTKASQYGAESGYTKASGYTGVGRDNHVSTYYKENMNTLHKNDFEVKVGDTLEHIRTGVLTKIKSINGNNITGEIIDIGDGSIPVLKIGDINKTNKLLINKTYKLISSIGESLIDIIKEELLNEVTYHKFKNEVKFRTKNEQLHKAIREVKRKLSEIDRIVEYTSRMKQELSEGEEGIRYWKNTEKNISTISEMVNQLNNKIKNLHQ
jgi:predicted transcriptional regulator